MDSPGVASALVSRHATVFQIIFHPASLVGHKKKNSLKGVDFDTFQYVSESDVMFCVNICVRRLPRCFCVAGCCFDMFFVYGFGHC